jgi:methylglutaconyl-CoA hydratase
MSELVIVQKLKHHALCTLNAAHKRNPISAEMRASLTAALDALAGDAQARSVIITGAGSAFCSGLDLEALAAQQAKSPAEQLADSESIAAFFSYLAHYPKPTIAAVNGPAVAGGCGLALLCDFTLMSSEAYFSFSEVKIGFVPALVGVYLERMVGPKTASDLLLTGRKVAAEEAQALRMATVVPPEGLQEAALQVAATLAKNSPEALRQTKALLIRAQALSLADALALAIDINAQARMTSDCREGVDAFLQKRAPLWAE